MRISERARSANTAAELEDTREAEEKGSSLKSQIRLWSPEAYFNINNRLKVIYVIVCVAICLS
jgi:hypothetical protein